MQSFQRKWSGKWIRGTSPHHFREMSDPAPYLRTVFDCPENFRDARAFACAPGWHEIYVNGTKVDDRALAPVVTQFNEHVSFIEYDIASLLHPGKNAVAFLLGNGWYNCGSDDVWNFKNAFWRDYPKLLCDVVIDGKTAAVSGKHWRTHASPVVFNSLRNGETYDARLEIPGFASPEFDDSSWENAVPLNPPGGLIVREDAVPCRIKERISPVSQKTIMSYQTVYDFGISLTGICEINVSGPSGTEVKLEYSERVYDYGDIDNSSNSMFIKSGEFQTERYILKGNPQVETWCSRFTYHGFRYVRVTFSGPGAELRRIEACFIHSDFRSIGSIECSDPTLNRLQMLTRRSYLSNFTGIPTDCPHREKNGWTGDASLAMETGLWNFDSARGYLHFLRILMDNQRPNGQIPSIAPTGGWGYWISSGPAWDSFIFEAVYQIYRFYGDFEPMKEYYDAMKRYLDYCAEMSVDGIADFGLGDWCHPDKANSAPAEVTSTGFYYSATRRMSLFAGVLNRQDDEKSYSIISKQIADSFNRKYGKTEGIYADGSLTALGTALYFGLAENPGETASALVRLVREKHHKADFGILGAKYVPRVLADCGYAEDAFQMLTQPEFPGWGYWVKSGATALWEHWNGRNSRNHIMFGDISAWMYQYLGGITPNADAPGFRHFEIKPCFVSQLDNVSTQYQSIKGMIKSSWNRQNGKIHAEFEIPAGSTADIVLPDETLNAVSGRISITFE